MTVTTAPPTTRRWWVLLALCLSVLLVSVDNTIVNVALPTLGRELVALRPAPGGLLVGTTTSKRPDLRRSVVVLKARVLPAPLRIDFAAPPP